MLTFDTEARNVLCPFAAEATIRVLLVTGKVQLSWCAFFDDCGPDDSAKALTR